MVLGVDVGNSNTKSSNGIIFESKVSTRETFSQCDSLVMNNTKYFIGEGEYDTAFRKVEKESYLSLLYGAITLSSRDIRNQVVLGLPFSQVKEDSAALKLKVMSNNDKRIIINGTERHIVIDDIEVVPEGIYTVGKEYEGIIVDIGGGTTDCCLVENVGGRKKIRNPYSDSIGTQKLYSDFIKLIDSKYGLDLRPSDAERIIKKGLSIYGEKQDINFAIDVFREYTDKLISRLQREYSLKTHELKLTGGGAKLLFRPISNRIKNCEIVENALFANAEAYENYGRSIWE